jgi:hypothetical protein
MKKFFPALVLSSLLLGCTCMSSQKTPAAGPPLPAKPAPLAEAQPWTFVVSGDSRNCGDVIMPAIAQSADKDHAQFYWHLGDLRLTSDVDEDIKRLLHPDPALLKMANYLGDSDGKNIGEWDDFKKMQIAPFGQIPFFLGIGNHETKPPQTRERFAQFFTDQLNIPQLQQQRAKDSSQDPGPKTYFHWIMGNVDFLYMDNASKEQFDEAQMKWFRQVLERDRDPKSPVKNLVVGMHEALPYSISAGHSMNESPDGARSGQEVYQSLLDFQKIKKVYILASHSHFFMDGIFKTRYWNSHGGVIPGWIVGTAGAVRYRLPGDAFLANTAKTDVYGYLLGTVSTDGSIKFDFHEFEQKDIPQYVKDRYPDSFVDWCFLGNKN